MIKAFVLLVIVIGISGAVTANCVSASTLNYTKVKNATVYVEDGFSGVVTIKDTLLNKTSNVTVDYQPYCTGSGVIVSKNGYIVTAFHVVSDSNTLENKNKLKKMSSSDVKWYVEELGLLNYLQYNDTYLGYKLFKNTPDNDQAYEKTSEQITNNFIKNGWISATSYENDIYVRGTALNGINSENRLKARLVDFGDGNNDEDVALLKVDTNGTNLPTLAISSKIPKKYTKLSLFGYPETNKETKQSLKSINYSPSVSSGILTAKSTNSHGIIYYRTSALTACGYSGGPAVNNKNQVIGILIYGLCVENMVTGKEKNVASLSLSSKYIIKICKKNKVPITVAH